MSYARFGWDGSDVYVYLDSGGFLTCCSCSLMPRTASGWHEWFKAYATSAMVEHLAEHRKAGHTAPQDTIDALLRDAAENDRWMANPKGRSPA